MLGGSIATRECPFSHADYCAGDDPKTVLMYFSNETQQDWRQGKREPDEAGGAFWLPGNVLLELHMVPPMSRGQNGDAQVIFNRLDLMPCTALSSMQR